MIQKSLILLILAFAYSFVLLAQPRQQGGSTFTVSGKIVDASTNEALEFATATAIKASDSSFISGTITNSKGEFELDVRPGKILIKFDFIGYESKFSAPISINRETPTVNLGKIQLKVSELQLKEAVVESERSQMVLSLEKRTFNVENDLSSIGGSAVDVLENVPSVNVDADGSISLRGSGNVRILINGKQSSLTGISSSDALQMIPANMIDRVEVITNPSARYDAEGMTGIINIVLKETKKNGTSAVVNLTTGFPEQYTASISLEHKVGKWTFTGNYGFRNVLSIGDSKEDRSIFSNGATTRLLQEENRERKRVSHTTALGLAYAFNKNNVLSIRGNYGDNKGLNLSGVDYMADSSNFGRLYTGFRNNREDEVKTNYDVSVDYDLKLKKGRSLNSYFSYSYSDDIENTISFQEFRTPSGSILPERSINQRINNVEGLRNGVFQTDYVHPINDSVKIEFGIKSSLRDINTDYSVDERPDEFSEYVSVPNFTNVLHYNEFINAAYAIYSHKWNKLSMAAGMRVEHTQILVEQKANNQSNTQEFIDPFPTLHFSYQQNTSTAYQISYSRRVQRPSFWSLNPFFNFNNPFSFFSGNPNLKPEYTNSMELTFIKYIDKASFSSSLYYRHTNNVIQYVQRVENEITLSRPENSQSQQSYGLEVNGNYTPYKWWRINATLNAYGSHIQAGNIANASDQTFFSYTAQVSSNTTINKIGDFQLRFNYRGPEKTIQGRRLEIAHLDFAYTRNIFKKNATISFKVNDVFNSRFRRSFSETPNFETYNERRWRVRTFVVGFTYRFNRSERDERGGRRGQGGDFGGDMDF